MYGDSCSYTRQQNICPRGLHYYHRYGKASPDEGDAYGFMQYADTLLCAVVFDKRAEDPVFSQPLVKIFIAARKAQSRQQYEGRGGHDRQSRAHTAQA